MNITYFRSSSFNTHGLCQMQYFLEYVLGIKSVSGKSAEKGTIVHKVMECLSKAKKAQQEDKQEYQDNIFKVQIPTTIGFEEDSYVEQLVYQSYKYYTHPKYTIHSYTDKDLNDCMNWTFKALRYNNGMFDPRKRHIIATEPYFEITLDEDWASYDYILPNNERLIGKLCIKGTIDLVTQVASNTYEVIDWKTGKRLDWATCQEKDFGKLSADPQLRIYHLALTKMYPKIPYFILTVNYINDGGPFTLPYGPDDIPKTLNMLKDKFKAIQKNIRPQLRGGRKHWWCTKICHHNKDICSKDPKKTTCQYIHQQLLKYGMETVVQQETCDKHQLNNYRNPGE